MRDRTAGCSLGAAGLAAAATLVLARPGAPAPGNGADALVVAAASWVAWLLALYLAVGVAAAVVASHRPRGALGSVVRVLVPAALRRAVAVLVGGAAAAATLAPAAYAGGQPGGTGDPLRIPAPSLDWPVTASTPAVAVVPRAVPDRAPLVAPPPGTSPAGERPGAQTPPVHLRAAAVTVRRGDSLWTIAARALGPRATPARVAAEWPRWWAANRAVIGSQPNLLRPGEHLLPPEATEAIR